MKSVENARSVVVFFPCVVVALFMVLKHMTIDFAYRLHTCTDHGLAYIQRMLGQEHSHFIRKFNFDKRLAHSVCSAQNNFTRGQLNNF